MLILHFLCTQCRHTQVVQKHIYLYLTPALGGRSDSHRGRLTSSDNTPDAFGIGGLVCRQSQSKRFGEERNRLSLSAIVRRFHGRSRYTIVSKPDVRRPSLGVPRENLIKCMQVWSIAKFFKYPAR
jgi:hypothetical protein